MPLVRMLTSSVTQAEDGSTLSYAKGQEVHMSADQAAEWADGVRGELVRGTPPETPEGNQRGRRGKPETPEGDQDLRPGRAETTTNPRRKS